MPKKTGNSGELPLQRPGTSPEARENQLIALAVDLAEKQLREGTASAQVITHYLKLASTTERIEKETKELKKELIKAQTENLKAARQTEELYREAIAAMRLYSGQGNEE